MTCKSQTVFRLFVSYIAEERINDNIEECRNLYGDNLDLVMVILYMYDPHISQKNLVSMPRFFNSYCQINELFIIDTESLQFSLFLLR